MAEYGYKKLGYFLERQDDQKFQNFDCFVVLVSSPFGRVTINYYDKKTGNLIMIIYQNLNKIELLKIYDEEIKKTIDGMQIWFKESDRQINNVLESAKGDKTIACSQIQFIAATLYTGISSLAIA